MCVCMCMFVFSCVKYALHVKQETCELIPLIPLPTVLIYMLQSQSKEKQQYKIRTCF